LFQETTQAMPYTASVTAYLTSLEHPPMDCYHVTDPAINAVYGKVLAHNEAQAKDIAVRSAGWASYAEYVAAAAKHSGTRTLEAEEIKVW
jgi:hypothetical protein